MSDRRLRNALDYGRPAHWIQTLARPGEDQGRAFDLINPTPAMVDFRTIAIVLSRVPRFAGHTERGGYSVAQHSREGAYAILRALGRRDAAAAFLLHDAHEAYIGDDSTPKQKALAVYADEWAQRQEIGNSWAAVAAEAVRGAYRMIKERIDSVIYPAAGMPWPLPADVAAIVKEYDIRMAVTERNERLATPPYAWQTVAAPVPGVDLYPWREGTTELVFRRALQDLCGIDTFSFA